MTDVLVIGGGIIGCGIARALAMRGAEVTLVDPRGVGDGASRASAGMLVPYSEGRHHAAFQILGERSLARYDALIHALDEEGWPVPFSRCGSIDVALDQDGATALADMAAALDRDAIAHDHLDGAALRAVEPAVSPEAIGGVTIPAHGAVDVPALVTALWRSACSRGARLIQAPARRIARSGAGVHVETAEGDLEAHRVVLAAGCWASQIEIAGVAPVPVQPVRGQLLVLRGAPFTLRHIVWGPGCYVVPWDEGTLLVGATVEHAGFDERATAEGVRGLLHAALALLPAAADAAFGEVRVGLRPATPDDLPIVGPSTAIEGLIYATGHYRNGALLSPLTAEAIADIASGTPLDPIWAPCDPRRFGL